MKYQPITSAEAARLLRSIIYQHTAEGLADMCADACTAEAITAQENGELPSVVAELQRAAFYIADASARMYSDRAELHALAAAAKN